jgi:hypothetical protein
MAVAARQQRRTVARLVGFKLLDGAGACGPGAATQYHVISLSEAKHD